MEVRITDWGKVTDAFAVAARSLDGLADALAKMPRIVVTDEVWRALEQSGRLGWSVGSWVTVSAVFISVLRSGGGLGWGVDQGSKKVVAHRVLGQRRQDGDAGRQLIDPPELGVFVGGAAPEQP